jgi:transcription elongation GreA/GreB family factor
VNKRALVRKIIAQLDAALESLAKSARSAHAEATDEQNKAENKYDTRGLEASYLARGQSRQAMETAQARQQFEELAIRDFDPGDAIDLGALVEVESEGDATIYFVAPNAGGVEISHEKKTVLVITPQSPLGRQLIGRKAGERLQIARGGSSRDLHIISVA